MNQSELTYLEKSIAGVVRRAIEEKLEMYEEVWLTADQMHQYFGTMKKSSNCRTTSQMSSTSSPGSLSERNP